MAMFLTLKCNSCGFSINAVWGSQFVANDAGERIGLPHPGDDYKFVANILIKDGHDPSQFNLDDTDYYRDTDSNELISSRMGMYSPMVCSSCLVILYIDLDKDPPVCDKCNSYEVKPVSTDMTCHKCSNGQMIKHGRRMMT